MTDYMQKARAIVMDADGALYSQTVLLHLSNTLKALDTERAAHEATKEAIKRQAAAVRTLQASEASEINILRKERHKAHEAIKTLESERAANALLTDELEATKAELQALREWRDMSSAPQDEQILAAIQVRHKNGQTWWERHIIVIDSETGTINDMDFHHGWEVDDYEGWLPLPRKDA